jgi:hypothetical protein
MTTKRHTVAEFEQAHGQPKLHRLEAQLEAERRKVAAIADVQGKVKVNRSASGKFKFGLLGDIHVGSLYFAGAQLQSFYEQATERGVTDFYCSGDVLDGHKVYRGQEFELRDIGIDQQINRLVEVAPMIGTTYFITGNHDGSFKTAAGVPVGKMIQAALPHWKFIGEEQARVEWQVKGRAPYRLMLIHPGGGSSYAISYRAQKITESLEGGTKPDLLGIGHYHKADMIPSYRNVSVFQTGTFQFQTPFMARQGLQAHVGGWVVEVETGEKWNSVTANFIAFYR